MPGGDRTGPMGMGPMTGRGAGYCAGYPTPGYMNPISGRGRGFGFGRGWGQGRGWGRRAYPYAAAPFAGGYYGVPYGDAYNPQMTPQNEADMLKDQAKAIQEELKAVNQRISELESAAKETK